MLCLSVISDTWIVLLQGIAVMPHSYSPIAGMKTANDFVFAPSQLNPSRGAGIPEYVKVIFFEK